MMATFGGFGQATGTGGGGGFSFGSSPALFGGVGSSTTQGTQAQPSLFGATQPQQGASLFGSSGVNQQQTSLFGSASQNPQQQPQTSLFGSPTPATQQTQSSLFGQPQQAPQQQSSLFGATTQPQTSLFGPSQAQQPASLFGTTGASQPQSTSLFGGPQTQASSLFGGAAPHGSTNTGLFGSSSIQPNTGGLFSANTGTGFGGGSSLFGGGQQQQAQYGSGLGFGTNVGQQSFSQSPGYGGFGSSIAGGGSPQEMPPGLLSILNAYNPRGPYCRFRHMVYNVVDEGTAPMYGRPSDTDEKLWDQAVMNNPDPQRLVPVQLSGFDELHRRVEMQQERVKLHQEAFSRIESDLSTATSQLSDISGVRLAELRRKYRQQRVRLLKVVCRIDALASRNVPFSSEEVMLRNRLLTIRRTINVPVSLRERLADLELLITSKGWKKSKTAPNLASTNAGSHPSEPNKTCVTPLDEKSLIALKAYLSDELQGIESLYSERESSERDLQILASGLRQFAFRGISSEGEQ